MKITDIHFYDDIINLPHHVSSRRPHMKKQDRAAQFGSFEALTGHSDAISETGRLTYEKLELSDYAIEILNSKLMYVKDKIEDHPEICLVWFEKDSRKEGGRYVTHVGNIKKIDEYRREIVFDDGLKIPVCDIYDITGEFFEDEIW